MISNFSLNQTPGLNLPQAPYSIFNHGPNCFWQCVRRPAWVIPPVSGVTNKNDENQKLALTRINLEANISNSLASVVLSAIFKNTMEKPVECVFRFPLNEEFAVSGVTVTMNDKIIETDIMAKEKAEQKYDDAVAQGNTAVKVNYSEETPDILSLSIGFLPK